MLITHYARIQRRAIKRLLCQLARLAVLVLHQPRKKRIQRICNNILPLLPSDAFDFADLLSGNFVDNLNEAEKVDFVMATQD